MANPASLPDTLQTRFFPFDGSFPELSDGCDRRERYLPSKHPFGVAISGGGTRSLSAAIGQMRALRDSGLIDLVGAVSCVSGGTWFGSLYNYAPSRIDDATLLGTTIAPGDLTVDNIAPLPSGFLGAPVPGMTNSAIGALVVALEALVKLGILPQNRVYARTLNSLLLSPFGLDALSTFFSLDAASVAGIVGRNPGLTASNFYTVRADRPYFIAGATQVFPVGQGSKDVLRRFEYSPLYTGTPQLFTGAGPRGQDFGGGWVESFAFDSRTPSAASGDTATVATPQPAFLLSDVMGSSGAAPGALLDEIDLPNLFPEFNYWPPIDVGSEPSAFYSFADGGDLEDTGIVPLLFRQYPAILAFVNAECPIGCAENDCQKSCVEGISGQISRLFGMNPEDTLGNTQDTQVFPKEQYADLVKGLQATKDSGAFFVDAYKIVEGNNFGIPPYPDGREVVVAWFYNNLNLDWKDRVTDPKIQALLNSADRANFFKNFPNYKTVFQNATKVAGIEVPELLLLTPQQVNLIGQMWSWTLTEGGGAKALSSVRERVLAR